MLTVPLPREPSSGAQARREVGLHFNELLGADQMHDARLIVSELVNNAYLHGRGAIELQLEVLSDRIRIAVIDQGSDATLKVQLGHGLQLVDELSLAWGARDGRTHVWAEVPLRS